MGYILVSIFFGFITGAIGSYIAEEKNRSPSEGFWFGFLLSLFGVLIVALLPNKKGKSQMIVNNEVLPKDEKSNSSATPILVGYGIVIIVIFYLLIIIS